MRCTAHTPPRQLFCSRALWLGLPGRGPKASRDDPLLPHPLEQVAEHVVGVQAHAVEDGTGQGVVVGKQVAWPGKEGGSMGVGMQVDEQ